MATTPLAPENLAEMIGYQTGSVVSREIFRSDNGSVTIFAFDDNQGLSKHQTVFDAFVIILEGQAQITIDDTEHVVSTGQILYMPANHPHALIGPNRFKMALFMIKAPLETT